jgi:thioredoxin reductase (NADPH)
MDVVDVAIIGAGPIGLEMHIGCLRTGLSVLHFDKGQIAETISHFPPLMRFFSSNERISLAGVPIQTIDQSKCSREEYLAYLRSLVRQFNLEIRTFEQIEQIEKKGDVFELQSESYGLKQSWKARYVILVTGGTARPRELNIPGENFPHVSHRFGDAHRYFRRRVVIIGGKNSAVEAALRCHHAFADVVMSYRGSEFNGQSVKYWLLPELKMHIKKNEVECHLNTIPVAILRNAVALENLKTGQTFEVPCDDVLIQAGFEADMSLFKKCGVRLRPQGQVPEHNHKTMQTNIEGLYVAGTAVAGTQSSYRVFLENCHIHTERIIAAITGCAAPETPEVNEELET